MRTIPIFLALLAASCVTTTEADLFKYFEQRDLDVTQGRAPEGAHPLQLISYYKSGFYLFGAIPVVVIDLEEAVEYVTERARWLEADGIAHLEFQYSPASLFKFTVFPLPDWSSWIHVSCMAYELPDDSVSPEALEQPAASEEVSAGA